jgi:hypothetical protein
VFTADLGGDLPCVQCKYNLRGLSVLGECPECSTAIRATVLAVVDPMASEFRPIARPRVLAAAVVLWPVGLLASVVTTLGATLLSERVAMLVPGHALAPWGWAKLLPAFFAAVSGLAACALIHPHEGVPRRDRRLAMLGVLAYVPAIALLVGMQGWGEPVMSLAGHTWWFAASGGMGMLAAAGAVALLAATLVCLRPNARRLAARSLLLRMGRVDRQTLRSLAGVLMLPVAGHVCGVVAGAVGSELDILAVIGGLFNVAGYTLFVLGMFGVILDCVRISRVIIHPPKGLEALLSVREDSPERGGESTSPKSRDGRAT